MSNSIAKIGVIGAGIMGSGIAQVSAAAGLNVVMVDVAEAEVKKGLANITRGLARLVAKEKLSQAEMDATLVRVTREHGLRRYRRIRSRDRGSDRKRTTEVDDS